MPDGSNNVLFDDAGAVAGILHGGLKGDLLFQVQMEDHAGPDNADHRQAEKRAELQQRSDPWLKIVIAHSSAPTVELAREPRLAPPINWSSR